MSYENMSDEDKVLQAIEFVARGAVMPHQLRSFLEEQGLYELIVQPTQIGDLNECSERSAGRY